MNTPILRLAALTAHRWLRPFLHSLIIFSAGLATASAQSGIVTGRVSNAATGAYLESATVAVEGSALQTVTARGGDYSLQVPPGRHTLVIGYTGLDTERATVALSR
jgi:hypothetical protein